MPLVTAQSRVVGDSDIRRPLAASPSIDFGNFINPVIFRWRKGINARIYDLNFIFNYQERLADGGDWFNRSITWNVAQNIEDASTNETTIEVSERAEVFYNFVASNIPVDPNMIRRAVNGEVMVIGGGGGTSTNEVDVVEFIRVEGANLGITSTQVVPAVTNLSEGRGIFGSTFTTTLSEIRLTELTIDSLINGSITQDLNFQ